MTELQVTINNLKDVITSGNRLLFRLEKQQKDLEKPPPHKWEHMDVFRNSTDCEMIYIDCGGSPPKVFCVGSCTGHGDVATWLKGAEFLFNLREKL